MERVRVEAVLSEDAAMPEYATEGSAGLDLRCSEGFELNPLERRLVPTGIRIALPPGFEAQVRPRSGLALRNGIGMVNAPGTIDADYRGEIQVLLINFGSDTVKFEKGERVAQLVISPVTCANIVQVSELDATVRGEGGFGSTGNG